MKSTFMLKYFTYLCLFGLAIPTYAWGFLGHRTINKQAVFALPPEMFGFYKKYIDYITQHAVDPDNRRYLFEDEACHHYLDCDHYEKTAPLDTLPHNWYKAIEKYSEDSLKAHGIVPWHIMLVQQRLTKAFEDQDLQKILKYSADIGHYIADAHVPLHASSNYNGQKTGQEGIHALWESRIPQLFLDSFNLFTGTVQYLVNPSEYIWDRMGESFACTDSVFKMEISATNLHPADKYSIGFSGRNAIETYSEKYCKDYEDLMQKMVERRMRASIFTLASFWYTAWVNAGQPNLDEFADELKSNKEDDDAEKAKDLNKIKGREEAK